MSAALSAACGLKLAIPPAVFPVSSTWKTGVGGLIDPPLATDGERLFVATRDGAVFGLGLADGKQRWRVRGRGRVSAAPGVLVLREEGGGIRRLDPSSGAELWRRETGVEGSLPAVIEGEQLFVAGTGLAALSLDTGEKLWANSDRMSAAPVASGGWLVTGEEDGAIRGRERSTGAAGWTFPTGGPVRAQAFVDRDHVLVGTTDGRLVALRLAKGTKRWRWKIGADVLEPARVLGPAALFVSYDNILYSVGRGNGHLLWRGILPSRPISGPQLSGTAVLVACQETEILAFDGRDGHRLGAFQTPAEIRTPPILVRDRLYVGLRDRSVVALALTATPLSPAAPTPAPGAGPRHSHGSPKAAPAPPPQP
jgi:outer membrane protein assembly factor BamB